MSIFMSPTEVLRLSRKLELASEDNPMVFHILVHATGGRVANHLRLPKRTDKELVTSSTIKKPKD